MVQVAEQVEQVSTINYNPVRRHVPASAKPGTAFPQRFTEKWKSDGTWRAGMPCSHVESWHWIGGAQFLATFIPRATSDGAGDAALSGEVHCQEVGGKSIGREYFVEFDFWLAVFNAGHIERLTA